MRPHKNLWPKAHTPTQKRSEFPESGTTFIILCRISICQDSVDANSQEISLIRLAKSRQNFGKRKSGARSLECNEVLKTFQLLLVAWQHPARSLPDKCCWDFQTKVCPGFEFFLVCLATTLRRVVKSWRDFAEQGRRAKVSSFSHGLFEKFQNRSPLLGESPPGFRQADGEATRRSPGG